MRGCPNDHIAVRSSMARRRDKLSRHSFTPRAMSRISLASKAATLDRAYVESSMNRMFGHAERAAFRKVWKPVEPQNTEA